MENIITLLPPFSHFYNIQSRFRVIGERDILRSVQLRIADIGECGSTLYVGLSGIVLNLIQKSTV